MIGENVFRDHAQQWWDPQGPMKLLHALTPLRMKLIVESWRSPDASLDASFPPSANLPSTTLKKRVIDVGCGGGLLCEPLARLGCDVVGIDALSESIATARAHALTNGLNERITYQTLPVEQLCATFPEDHFHTVTAFELLEHLANPAQAVQAIARVTQPNGFVFFSTLDRTLASALMAIVFAERVVGWIPRGTHVWSSFIRPSTLNDWCVQAGLTVTRILEVTYQPLSQTWSFTPRRRSWGINYVVVARKNTPHPHQA